MSEQTGKSNKTTSGSQPKATMPITSDAGGHFYWKGHQISNLWYDFFAGLSSKDERDCERLFIEKYGAELDRKFGVTT